MLTISTLKMIARLKSSYFPFFQHRKLSVFHRMNSAKLSTNINYVTKGRGEKSLLFMPGALGSIYSDFAPQVKAFEKLPYNAVFWDPPGYGKSRPPNRDFSPGFFERDSASAVDLMKRLGHQKFSLMGWSDGGITALMMAVQYPENIEKLVLWGANAYIDNMDLELYESVRDISKWSDRMRKPMVDMYGLEYFQKTWKGWIDAMTRIFQEQGGVLYPKDLSEVTCPTLIIHGDKDAMVGVQQALALHEKLKNSELVRWKEGKHNLHLRYAEEFNDLVLKFLEKDN